MRNPETPATCSFFQFKVHLPWYAKAHKTMESYSKRKAELNTAMRRPTAKLFFEIADQRKKTD